MKSDEQAVQYGIKMSSLYNLDQRRIFMIGNGANEGPTITSWNYSY
jgi:hypothetical protein